MQIAVDIPDNIPNVVAPDQEPARAALEAMALQGYRSQRLSEYDVQELLGFGTRMEVHAFLKQHDVHLNYGMEDLEHDIREANRMLAVMNARESAGEQRAG